MVENQTYVDKTNISSMEKPIVCEGCKMPKGCGEELIIKNNERYCGDLLIFKKGYKFSTHHHMIKDETWYVDKGTFVYRWIDTETVEKIQQYLKPKDVVRQRPGQPHQLEALEDGVVFEVSTQMPILIHMGCLK